MSDRPFFTFVSPALSPSLGSSSPDHYDQAMRDNHMCADPHGHTEDLPPLDQARVQLSTELCSGQGWLTAQQSKTLNDVIQDEGKRYLALSPDQQARYHEVFQNQFKPEIESMLQLYHLQNDAAKKQTATVAQPEPAAVAFAADATTPDQPENDPRVKALVEQGRQIAASNRSLNLTTPTDRECFALIYAGKIYGSQFQDGDVSTELKPEAALELALNTHQALAAIQGAEDLGASKLALARDALKFALQGEGLGPLLSLPDLALGIRTP